jgi:hypothetical protein
MRLRKHLTGFYGAPGYSCTVIASDLYIPRLARLFSASDVAFQGVKSEPLAGPATEAHQELDVCLGLCRGSDLICFNLVSRGFGFHIADMLSKPCLCLSPSTPPPAAPPSLHTIRALIPAELLQRGGSVSRRHDLETETESSNKRARLAESAASPPPRMESNPKASPRRSYSLFDVEHWLLSLFLPLYREFRVRHGFPEYPDMAIDLTGERLLPSPLVAPISPAQNFVPGRVTSTWPILYGISEGLCPKPGFWPERITFTGSVRPASPLDIRLVQHETHRCVF